MNQELTGLLELNVNAKVAAFGYELIDQVRVKLRKQAPTTMQDGDLRSNTHGQMSKFEGDIPAADK